jgi:alkylhydroperoxidase family enzyme
LQGEEFVPVAAALRDGDLDRAPVSPAERLLLEFVGTLTRHAYRITDEQVQALRDVGWSDAQIAEAVYDGALFNVFVRLADAFDIHPPAMMDPDGVPRAVTDGPPPPAHASTDD